MIVMTFEIVTELHGALMDRNSSHGLDGIAEKTIKEMVEKHTQSLLRWESPRYLNKAQQTGIVQLPMETLGDPLNSK